MVIVDFLGSQAGRVVRVATGAGLIVTGLFLGGWWTALAVVGVVPLAAGALDVCVLGPLVGHPFGGKAFRRARARQVRV